MRRTALFIVTLFTLLSPSLPVFAETVNVNAVVPASDTDFSATLTTTDTTDPVGQAHSIPFTITYANKLAYATSVTLKASWTKGTVQGDLTPSTEVLHYVPSSASNGYGNTPPVIDTVNRTITWTISSLPGNDIQQDVTFSLESSSSLISTTPISFEITTVINGPGTQTEGNVIERSFRTEEPTIAPTNTPGPTSANTALTPTPTPQPSSLTEPIQNVGIRSIQSTQSDIGVTLLTPSSVTVSYGTSPKKLDQSVSYTTRARTQVISLRGLKPSTTYYFTVTAKDAAGTVTVSDIFSFKTSSGDLVVLPEINSFVISSNEIILASGNDTQQDGSPSQIPTIVLPTKKLYEFRFSIADAASIKDIRAFLRNKKVLGLSSIIDKAYAETELVDLIETSPGVYLGRLRAPLTPGTYELFLRINDAKGNMIEKKVSEIKVTNPFTVLASGSNETIEGAQVTLFIYNAKKKVYEKLQQNSLSLKNPLFTNKDGVIDLVLPHGRYKATIKTLHYKETTSEFTIGERMSDSYPTIYLQSASFDPLSYASYFISGMKDVFIDATSEYLASLSGSRRMLHLTMLSVLGSLLLLSLLSTSARMQIPLVSLPSYLLHHLKKLFHAEKNVASIISGVITDHQHDHALASVNIYFLDPETDQTVAHAVTNKNGEFKTSLGIGTYKISVLKSGYQALTLTKTLSPSQKLPLALATHPRPETIQERLLHFLQFVLSTSFEILLFGNLFLLVVIALQSDWRDIMPLVFVSGCNVVLWYLHRR